MNAIKTRMLLEGIHDELLEGSVGTKPCKIKVCKPCTFNLVDTPAGGKLKLVF